MKISGNIYNFESAKFIPSEMTIENGFITSIKTTDSVDYKIWIVPGMIDSHIHIESSLVKPSEFAIEAVRHGTIAVVSDPHEIANVCGIAGIDFMIEDGKKSPLKFYFGAPSCVPATNFETAGAIISSNDIGELLLRDDI